MTPVTTTGLSVLFIGGSGVISSAAAELAVARGHRLTVLNRGQSALRTVPDAAEVLTVDVRDASAVAAALGERTFDVVVDFVAFTPEHVSADIAQFAGKCGQYVFISSASAYQKPPGALPIRESTPLRNPYWQYSRDKIAGEDVLMAAYRDEGFPVTVIRPSHTYDRTQIALLGGWTDIHRMRTGQPVVVHGDGTSLWTLTHSTDFAKALVGLFGRSQAVGDSFTITSDEYLPWDAIYAEYARAAGAPAPTIVHVASDTMAAENPDWSGPLLGDRSHSVIFDNGKVRALVPDFVCTTPVALGFREAIAWFDAHPEQQVVDSALNATLDRLVAAHATVS
ncbi:NAD-dependent epimerase/dehydratase family protein [Cryobacterium sp. SO2]|uniref:NAD-dependent epimerase/dehydratase family protein n=1 Tax=Cryobacterium sp. SO2 TaxID=1897060 RepID=UPI00223E12FC|nr:NAD-dependent epimerase/dehydratase family protein [Cryobacterium sp. SO2]WEO77247.1 NAD-dependent epimerase/dehydratase family protein [Cryobacterium sp. SO2]